MRNPIRSSRGVLTATALAIAATMTIGPSAAAAISAAQTAGQDRPTGRDAVGVVTYSEDDSVIANPARGFYKHTETRIRADGTGWTPLDAGTLASYREQGITQILRVVYLERYVTSDLDAQLFDALDADFATARESGVSVILRFAYVQGGAWPYSPPYGDASVERVLSHIEQLTPLLRANADVIAVMQSGFVGLWGEGYYTDSFVADPANPGVVTDADWANRTAVVEALLAALPESRSVQVRTMLSKQKAFDRPTGTDGALTPEDAYTGSAISRVGHHNDCFLASPDDFGTFLSDPISLDQDYLAAETRFVPMGGETCNVNPPRSEWDTASAELQRYGYSYLNRDYNQDVLNSWGPDNLTEVSKKLGYRFVLEESRVVGGANRSLEIDIRNEGWAAPYNPRPASVVLDGPGGPITLPLDSDARTWAPGETTTVSVALDDVPAGTYRASLALPAPEAAIADDPRFAIRTANTGTWVADRGLNDLQQTIEIADTTRPTTTLVTPSSAAPQPALSLRIDAEDDTGLRRIVGNVYQNGRLVKSTQTAADGAASATHTATVALPDGSYTLRYNSQDLSGNISVTRTFDFTIDATTPRITVKSGPNETVGANGEYSLVSFKLFDAGKIDTAAINGVVKDLTDNAWSDVNFVRPGVFGATTGANTLVVTDVAGNSTTFRFTLR